MELYKLDGKDRKILEALTKNGRAAYKEIAETLNMSESTVRKRIQKLLDRQIISRFTITVNPDKTGNNILSFLTIAPTSQSDIKKLAESLIDYPEVIESYYLDKGYDSSVVLELVGVYSAEGNSTRENILEYWPRMYYQEKLLYLSKWGFPIILQIAGMGVFRYLIAILAIIKKLAIIKHVSAR